MATVNRKELADLLAQVMPGVGAKESTLQETCFVFKNGYIYTYNDEICVSVPLMQALAEDDSFSGFAIQARELQILVNKLRDEELDMTMEDGLVIKTKRAKAEMKIETQVRMPVDEIEFPKKFLPLPERFSTALKDVLPAVGRDQTKETSVCVHLYDDRVEASDSNKAARYTFDKKVFKEYTNLPRLSAGEVVKFNPTGYGVTEGWIHFENGDAVMSCRTLYKGQEGPDVSGFLDEKGIVLVLPDELPNALERAGVFIASIDGKEITHENKYVHLLIADNWCVISGEGGVGKYEEKMRVDYTGGAIQFTTDVNTLVNAVAENQTCEICAGHVKIFDKNFSYLVSFGRPKAKKEKAA